MGRCKRIGKRLFCLPLPLTVLIALPSFLFVFYGLATGLEGPASYASFALSAYGLIITITATVRIARVGVSSYPLVKKIRKNPLWRRYREDLVFQIEVSLTTGLVIGLLYIGIKLAFGIYYRSTWFVALAVYYTLLALMRLSLLCYLRRNPIGENQLGEWRRYRLCGIILLLMNQALGGIVAFIVWQNRGYDYPGVLIYAMATYTFYITITSVRNLIRFRKFRSPVLSAAKVIGLVAAMVSMLSLTTAMLARFGADDNPMFRPLMTGMVGAGICVIVLVTAIFMIAHATKEMKKANIQNQVTP